MDLILAFVNSIWHFTHHALIFSGETMNYLWYADIIKKKSSILLLFNNYVQTEWLWKIQRIRWYPTVPLKK